jgi:hypothetical protein
MEVHRETLRETFKGPRVPIKAWVFHRGPVVINTGRLIGINNVFRSSKRHVVERFTELDKKCR